MNLIDGLFYLLKLVVGLSVLFGVLCFIADRFKGLPHLTDDSREGAEREDVTYWN